MNEIRNYTRVGEAETVSLRQLNARDGAVHEGYAEVQGEPGTWVIEAKHSAGMGETLVDLRDVLVQAARANPKLLIEALQNAGAISPLR